jgi:hypothetical protein
MTDSKPLPKISIAEPCPMAWAELAGDDKQRFCSQCEKHVVNGQEMTHSEVVQLVREGQGQLCMRLATDEKGTVRFKAAPKRVRSQSIVKRAGLVIAAGGLVAACHSQPKNMDPSDSKAIDPVEQPGDSATDGVEWDGPGVLLGEVCVEEEVEPDAEALQHVEPVHRETLGRIRLVPLPGTETGNDPENDGIHTETGTQPEPPREILGTPAPLPPTTDPDSND